MIEVISILNLYLESTVSTRCAFVCTHPCSVAEAHRTHSVSLRRCPFVLLKLVRIEPEPRTLVALRVCGVGIRRCPVFFFSFVEFKLLKHVLHVSPLCQRNVWKYVWFCSLFRDTTCSGSPKDSAPPLTALPRRSIPDWPSATLLHCTVISASHFETRSFGRLETPLRRWTTGGLPGVSGDGCTERSPDPDDEGATTTTKGPHQ